jgi:hypothetical protein
MPGSIHGLHHRAPAHTVRPLARPFRTREDASPPAQSRRSALFQAGSAHGCLAGGLGINLGLRLAQWISYVVARVGAYVTTFGTTVAQVVCEM